MTSYEIRSRARESLRGRWPLAIGVAALATLLGGIGNRFLPDITIPVLSEWLSKPLFEYGNFRITSEAGAFGILFLILCGPLELGYAQFMLKLHSGEPADVADLFSRFDRFLDGFLQDFLRGLYTTLWSLLLIIPGIVKGYSYRMTPYIMLDHPELFANDAITRSRELMDGHKGELFVLDLSFIGWSILSALSFNLGYLALNPYHKAAEAAFYRNLTASPQTAIEA